LPYFKPDFTYGFRSCLKNETFTNSTKNNKQAVTEGFAKTIEKGGNASDYSGKIFEKHSVQKQFLLMCHVLQVLYEASVSL
jgi:hypothetical protein